MCVCFDAVKYIIADESIRSESFFLFTFFVSHAQTTTFNGERRQRNDFLFFALKRTLVAGDDGVNNQECEQLSK